MALRPDTAGIGTSVTINGSNFTGATGVKFGAVAATFVLKSGNQIIATVPATATSAKISVTGPDGTATSATNFAVVSLLPSISSFTPSSGRVGTEVTINGTNLTTAIAVGFNRINAGTITVVSATSIRVKVPVRATTGRISVANAAALATSSTDFTVLPFPSSTM